MPGTAEGTAGALGIRPALFVPVDGNGAHILARRQGRITVALRTFGQSPRGDDTVAPVVA